MTAPNRRRARTLLLAAAAGAAVAASGGVASADVPRDPGLPAPAGTSVQSGTAAEATYVGLITGFDTGDPATLPQAVSRVAAVRAELREALADASGR